MGRGTAGMRDRLIHGTFGIDLEHLMRVVRERPVEGRGVVRVAVMAGVGYLDVAASRGPVVPVLVAGAEPVEVVPMPRIARREFPVGAGEFGMDERCLRPASDAYVRFTGVRGGSPARTRTTSALAKLRAASIDASE